ncbi:MAG: 50S ribosomal protein L13 [Nanoarchaeota archaeon]|nr:50S ribosomal protein L13 [Nanoarchaeota archaeon]
MTPRVIDAKDLIVGRLCSYIAKQSLLGQSFDIINIEQSIITGKPQQIFAKYRQKTERGRPTSGPFIHRSARELFKRSLRNMLPYKNTKGIEALARIKIYKGVPARFKEVQTETLQSANVSKVPNLKYVRLQEITKHLGGK